jgi:anti-anti-sigma factor
VPYHAEVDWGPTPLVRVTGPIDITTADNLDALLRTTARGGAIDLTVDLSGVTHLASAGVRVLHRLTHALTRQHTALRLIAPPDSPADLVLDLVGLPHDGQHEATTP